MENLSMHYELTVVMPVYNEEEIIQTVLISWAEKLTMLGINYQIMAINDGSKDHTLQKMYSIENKVKGLHIVDKKNEGHGPTILMGYRSSDSDWIFQIDSDNEMRTDGFESLWSQRDRYDFLLGARNERKSPLTRKVVSCISRITVHLLYGNAVYDVNSPYRLLKKSVFEGLFAAIPDDTFAPNVLLSGYVGYKKMSNFETDIPYIQRETGVVSIRKYKLLKAATKSWLQTVLFRFRLIGKQL
jgi:dolichol-phosphate mannosyltransferase